MTRLNRAGRKAGGSRWPIRTVEQRFMSHVEISLTGCWLWTASVNVQTGYAQFLGEEKLVRAHVWAYRHWRGEVPKGKELHHEACQTRRCVNPWHVEPYTRAEHPDSAPSVQRAKTHCPAGHEYSGVNLFIESDGSRKCRECRRANQRKRSRITKC
jgi:hypothetical protein